MTRYVAPAEEDPHARTWMAWPSWKDIYIYDDRQDAYYDDVKATIGRLAAAIAEHEPVSMCVPEDQHDIARAACGDKVDLVAIPTDDMWARDSGPVFVSGPNGEKAGVTFNFNAWGGKWDQPLDAKLSERILTHCGVREIKATVVGEGGGFEYDGEGTLLLTESCWVNENRNPGKSRDDIESELRRVLGVEQVIWLQGVADEEETDGHIDGYVRYIRPGVVMMSGIDGVNVPSDTDTIWEEDYRDARERLSKARDAAGRPFEIVELPWATKSRSDDPRFFTSYANFYVGNGAVYSPHFGDDAADARAEETLAQLFPGRRIVMLDVDRIYENGGGIHCVTQQEPV
ncbi:MAG: agmatine deiminase family protein [Pseudomonadota bacterium]